MASSPTSRTLPPQHRGLYKLLRDNAGREHNIPGSLRRCVAAETLRGWLRDYRRGGFDALGPKQRADQGSSRSIPPQVVDHLCMLKDDEPALTVPSLIKRVREKHGDLVSDEVTLAESTVHRLLARCGLMRNSRRRATPGTSPTPVRPGLSAICRASTEPSDSWPASTRTGVRRATAVRVGAPRTRLQAALAAGIVHAQGRLQRTR